MASVGSAAFTVQAVLSDASVEKVNAGIERLTKDLKIGSEVDQAQLRAVLTAANVQIQKAKANVKIGADLQSAQIDATVAKAQAKILALSEEGGTNSGNAFNSSFRDVAFSPAVIGAAAAAGLTVLPGVFAAAGGAGAVALGAAFAIKGSAELQKQGKSLISGLESTVESAATVLDKPLEQAFDALGKELPTLKSLLSSTFSTAAPLVKPLEQMLTSIVNGALPGFNSLLKSAQGPLESFFTDSGRIIGQGLGKFFADLGSGAQGSLQGIEALESGTLVLVDDLAKLASALGNVVRFGGDVHDKLTSIGQAMHIPDAGKNLPEAIGDLSNKLASVSGGSSWQKFLANARATGAALQNTANAAADAGPKVGTLTGDIGVLASRTSSADSQLQAFTDLWNTFVGKSVSDQTAVLNVASAFENYAGQVKTSGANTTTAQLAFENIISTMGDGLSTLEKNGASIGKINDFYATNISKLNDLKGLLPDEKQQVEGLTSDYIAWANSTSGLDTMTQKVNSTIESNFLPNLDSLHIKGTLANVDMGDLANAITKTGTTSDATKSARAALIADLENAGVQSDTAKTLVSNLEKQISELKGKSVVIAADVSGAIANLNTFNNLVHSLTGTTVEIQEQTLLAPPAKAMGGIVGIPHAAGGRLVRGSGPAGRDSTLVMAAPGELIVPASHAPAFADVARRESIAGFNGTVARDEPGVTAGMPPMTTYQGAQLIGLLQKIATQNERMPYDLASGLNQANAQGVRRAWFATSG